MENAQVTLNVTSQVPVVKVVGEIDIATVPLLQSRLDEIPDGTHQAIVDLSGLTFIDSSGLSALVACQKRFDTGTDHRVVQLVVSRDSILNVFEITGLREIFPITATIEEAMATA